MKIARVVAGVAVLALFSRESEGAGPLTTAFSVTSYVGDTPFIQAIPTPDGKRMMLPASLDRWSCVVDER